MSYSVIRVDNLSKSFRIRHQWAPDSLGELVSQAYTALFRHRQRDHSRSGASKVTYEEFWALKGISFEVEQAEVLGIIGSNGAGKSTLLKILSRITRPTKGSAEITGRVGSLLEVGTGFHPELTGRENIYLNGAILGMKRADIARKFDEIVAFSEIEKFLDTPVKRYSSGMYTRLAFAVAAHLEPEILIVDEVLAVGDASFQKKCLGKMDEVAKGGRTVLFVSHNMAAIQKLCQRVILLRGGHIRAIGDPGDMMSLYLDDVSGAIRPLPANFWDANPNSEAIISGMAFNGRTLIGGKIDAFCGGPASFSIDYAVRRPLSDLSFHIGIYDSSGAALVHLSSRNTETLARTLEGGTVTCTIDRLPLAPQRYQLNVSILRGREELHHIHNAAFLDVHSGDFFGTGDTSSMAWAPCLVDHNWIVGNEKPQSSIEQGGGSATHG